MPAKILKCFKPHFLHMPQHQLPRKIVVKNKLLAPELREHIASLRQLKRDRNMALGAGVAMFAATAVKNAHYREGLASMIAPLMPTAAAIGAGMFAGEGAEERHKKIAGAVKRKFLAPHAYEQIPRKTLEQIAECKFAYVSPRGNLVFTNKPHDFKFDGNPAGRKRYPTGAGK